MDAPDWTLARYRPLLHLHVRQVQIGRLYRARFDSSDVVQETLARAVRGLDAIRGKSEAELVAWLRAISGNVLVDLVREHGAGKRDPRLERSADGGVGDTDTPFGAYLASLAPGPSTLVGLTDDVLSLAAAIDQLPEAERDAIIAHYLLGLPLAETADRLGRTMKGVAGLLFRGKQRLREILARSGHEP